MKFIPIISDLILEKMPDIVKQRKIKRIKSISQKYKNVRQFALENPKDWDFIRYYKLIDDIFPNRKKYKPDGYWTPENIDNEAQKYDNISEFEKNNQVAYLKALEFGMIRGLFPERKVRKDSWTEDKIISTAKKYDNISDFRKNNQVGYVAAKKNNLLNILFPNKQDKRVLWTDEKLEQEAKKYGSKIEFYKGNHRAYDASLNRGLINIFFPKRKERISKWSIDAVKKEAEKYETLRDFRSNANSAYLAAHRHNIINDLFPQNEKLIKKGREYKTSDNLIKTNRYLWNQLFKLKLLDKTFGVETSTKSDMKLESIMNELIYGQSITVPLK